jgi:hypothetical protein
MAAAVSGRPSATQPPRAAILTRPELTRPELTRPELTRPELTRPELTRPELTLFDAFHASPGVHLIPCSGPRHERSRRTCNDIFTSRLGGRRFLRHARSGFT